MLLVHSPAGWLLRQRKATGIWGGLLSPPELPADVGREQVLDWLRGQGLAGPGHDAVAIEADAPLRHAFTHFRLLIRPWRVSLPAALVASEPASEPASEALAWLPMHAVADAALPTPVRRLLERDSAHEAPARVSRARRAARGSG